MSLPGADAMGAGVELSGLARGSGAGRRNGAADGFAPGAVSPRRHPMRAACAVLLLTLIAGLSKPVSADLLGAAPAVPANPLLAVAYADAMVDCSERIRATLVLGCDLVPSELETRHSFWIWRSETGATVSRTRKGDYRVRSGACLGGFCSWLGCRVTEWPALECSDGARVRAKVPDEMRFVLDGTDYVRVRQAQ